LKGGDHQGGGVPIGHNWGKTVAGNIGHRNGKGLSWVLEDSGRKSGGHHWSKNPELLNVGGPRLSPTISGGLRAGAGNKALRKERLGPKGGEGGGTRNQEG